MQELFTKGARVSLYARVSTEEQREGQTIDSQIAELERFARDRGWQIAGIYKDEGWSGGVMERPELDRLRDDARKGVFSAVVINDVDRLARDVTHLGVVKRDLERHSIQVIFRKLPAENSPTHNLMVNILGSFAEFERELIADRTRRGRRHKVEVRKQFLGTRPAYGFSYTPANPTTGRAGRLQVVRDEAIVVRKMFAWVDHEGLSARKVLQRLNQLGIRPREGAKTWGRSSVNRILRNEMYAGVWHYNKHQRVEPQRRSGRGPYSRHVKSSNRKRPKSEWLPWRMPEELWILQREQWERVQQQLDRNITFSPRNEKHSYLLKGLVRCGGCGSRYVGDPSHGRFYYRCIERCKRFPTIQEHALNDAVWTAVSEAILDPEVLVEQARRHREDRAKRVRDREADRAEANGDLKKLERAEARILDAYRQELITPAQLGVQLETIRAERETLRDRLDPNGGNEANGTGVEEAEESIRSYCREAATNLKSLTREQRQQFLRLLIREIVFVGTAIRIRGSLPLKQPSRPQPATDRITKPSPGGIVTTSIAHRGPNPAQSPEFQINTAILT